LQLALLERLGLPYPKARVINHPSQAASAAEAVVVSADREAEYRGKRCGHQAIFIARTITGCGR